MKTIKIYFLHNGDFIPRYVGSTIQNLQIRKENHMSDFRGNNIEKYNWVKESKQNSGLFIELIEECVESKRYERESFWIREYRNTLFNINEGLIPPESFRKLMSQKMKGRIFSEITIQRMIKAQAPKRKKVIANGQIFESIHHASKILDLSPGFICACCQGHKKYKPFSIEYGNP